MPARRARCSSILCSREVHEHQEKLLYRDVHWFRSIGNTEVVLTSAPRAARSVSHKFISGQDPQDPTVGNAWGPLEGESMAGLRGALVSKAHTLVYYSIVGVRVLKKREEKIRCSHPTQRTSKAFLEQPASVLIHRPYGRQYRRGIRASLRIR